jgi:hypothetical protein
MNNPSAEIALFCFYLWKSKSATDIAMVRNTFSEVLFFKFLNFCGSSAETLGGR